TNDAVGGLGFRGAVVDVGAQRVQRHATFSVPLGAGDLDAVQTTGAHDLDALGTQAHGVLHRALHGAAEHDALLELLGDRVGDQLGIDFGLAHFLDVHGHRHAQADGEFLLQVLDVLALLADHHARTRRVDGDAGVLGRALDQHAGDRGVLQLDLEVVADLDVLAEHVGEVTVVGVPTGVPVAGDGQAEDGRIDLLSHVLPQFPTVTYTWHVPLLMRLPRPLARAVKRFSTVPCST